LPRSWVAATTLGGNVFSVGAPAQAEFVLGAR
jgi:hypothetical protein